MVKSHLLQVRGSGMGKAQAILYASEGAKVIIADINEETVNQTASDIKSAWWRSTASYNRCI